LRASLGLSTFLTVRVLPSGSRTFAAIRRTSLRFRLRTVRSFFVGFMRTVTRRPAATEKRFALSLSFFVVCPPSVPRTRNGFLLVTTTFSGAPILRVLAESFSETSVFAPNAVGSGQPLALVPA
jgi:hypothetical protein